MIFFYPDSNKKVLSVHVIIDLKLVSQKKKERFEFILTSFFSLFFLLFENVILLKPHILYHKTPRNDMMNRELFRSIGRWEGHQRMGPKWPHIEHLKCTAGVRWGQYPVSLLILDALVEKETKEKVRGLLYSDALMENYISLH